VPGWVLLLILHHLFLFSTVQRTSNRLAVALGQPAGRVDQRRSRPHRSSSRSDQRQIRLRFGAAVPHRTQQLRIDPRQLGEGSYPPDWKRQQPAFRNGFYGRETSAETFALMYFKTRFVLEQFAECLTTRVSSLTGRSISSIG